MKKILLILILVSNSIINFGQDVDIPFNKDTFADKKEGFDKAVKEIKLGDIHFYRGSESDLSNALTHYLVADKFNQYSSDLNYKMGICYLHSTQKFKALKHLKFAEKTQKEDQFDDLDFQIGQAYQLSGDFDKAIEKFSSYKSELSEKDKDQRYFINKKISECRTGQVLTKNPKRVWIDNLGPKINSEYPDFGPVISADNRVLFYTSRRPGTTGGKIDEAGFYYEDIYYSNREQGTEWEKAKNIGDQVNTDSHDATVGLAPDGKSLLTYHGISRKDGNVLITKQDENGDWIKTKNIGDAINTKHHESAATLSFDEKTLFFVSNKPGGFGGHDIYVSYWDNEKNEWGQAENVGPTLNTEYEEKGVFFHPDNKTMYFSSEGHKTMGGLDIFKTVYNYETKEWSEPENIGSPINTPDDDVYFVVSGNERYAYYSSFQDGGYGEKDIYRVTFLGAKKDPVLALAEIGKGNISSKSEMVDLFNKRDIIILRGVVKDGNTNQTLIADLSVIDSKTNEKYGNGFTNPDGSYMIIVPAGGKYAITSTATGYTIDSKTVPTSIKNAGSEIVTNLSLYPPTAGHEFVLRNIYFDFDKSDLRHKSVEELNKLIKIMNENPTLRIELGGHTDRRGPDFYNQLLSKRRAKIAKEYLVKNNISSSRIVSKGYGETKPEISGNKINALPSKKQKEEAHQQNRRTVVTIISK